MLNLDWGLSNYVTAFTYLRTAYLLLFSFLSFSVFAPGSRAQGPVPAACYSALT